MNTKVRARYSDGEIVTMLVAGECDIGDRVRGHSDDAVAVVVSILDPSNHFRGERTDASID